MNVTGDIRRNFQIIYFYEQIYYIAETGSILHWLPNKISGFSDDQDTLLVY